MNVVAIVETLNLCARNTVSAARASKTVVTARQAMS